MNSSWSSVTPNPLFLHWQFEKQGKQEHSVVFQTFNRPLSLNRCSGSGGRTGPDSVDRGGKSCPQSTRMCTAQTAEGAAASAMHGTRAGSKQAHVSTEGIEHTILTCELLVNTSGVTCVTRVLGALLTHPSTGHSTKGCTRLCCVWAHGW